MVGKQRCTILQTSDSMDELNRLMLAVSNEHVNIEFIFERVRVAINDYYSYEEVITVISDLMRIDGITADLHNAIMVVWCRVLLNVYYHVSIHDLQLPIIELKLQHLDLCITTSEG